MIAVYWFSVAAMPKDCKVSGLKLHALLIFRFWRSRVQCGSHGATIQVSVGSFLETVGEKPSLARSAVGIIQSLEAVALRFPCPCWLSAGSHPYRRGASEPCTLSLPLDPSLVAVSDSLPCILLPSFRICVMSLDPLRLSG